MGAHIHIITYTPCMITTKHMYTHVHSCLLTDSHTYSGLARMLLLTSKAIESSCFFFPPDTCSHNKEYRKGLRAKDRKGK